MTEFADSVASAALALSPWEVAAVLLLIAYLVLAIRQNIWCWAAAFVGTCIYVVLMYQARLYMESALQVFYLGMAVYGWHHWRHGPGPGNELPVTTWEPMQHVLAITTILALTFVTGTVFDRYSDAALPYLDSFTTWGAIVTTWMVARKILENWIYWFAIDSVSIYLYVSRELHLTALLFVIYLVLIVFGYLAWRKELEPRASVQAAA